MFIILLLDYLLLFLFVKFEECFLWLESFRKDCEFPILVTETVSSEGYQEVISIEGYQEVTKSKIENYLVSEF